MRNKPLSISMLIFSFVFALAQMRIPEVKAQEVVSPSSGGNAYQDVPANSDQRYARLVYYGAPLPEGTKFDAQSGSVTSQGTLKLEEEALIALDNGYVENDKCDCAQTLPPESQMEMPLIK
jgi:hypothetical protein